MNERRAFLKNAAQAFPDPSRTREYGKKRARRMATNPVSVGNVVSPGRRFKVE